MKLLFIAVLLTTTFLLTSCQFSQAEKDQIIQAHNVLRSRVNPPALSMPDLTWDTQLESIALSYLQKCISTGGSLVDHNPNRGVNYSTSVGENIYASTGSITNVSVGGMKINFTH